jgi:methionine-rich copper-binding protein CopC
MAAVTRMSIGALIVGGALLWGCAAQDSAVPASSASAARQSILASSSPAAGSTVRSPVEELQLRFDPPARLDEVIVSGPDGTMPTMVHAVGEVADYSIPLSGLGPGPYTVNWRAISRAREYSGSFGFTVQ